MATISEFRKQYYFLSNFYASPLVSGGILYPTVEHAFQATKTLDKDHRLDISHLLHPGQAKSAGRNLKLRRDWEDIKVKVMTKLIRKKFKLEPLRAKLLETDNATLIEGNWWGDEIWGVSSKTGNGKNLLGKILMKERASLQE